ncbi:sensor histidine kinase [Marinobacterium jannaschii]|uniref:sensor histidine kinase n=1 Tax=Marinobacterium jannaschii TaxID=64970 RepID=UPI0004830329|nr:ATP-binding protein [Marinobacterium jannaschii]
MNDHSDSDPVLLVADEPQLMTGLLPGSLKATHCNSFRACKKIFRQFNPWLIVMHISDDASEQRAGQVAGFIREGLADRDARMIVAHPPEYSLNALDWMERWDINGFICLDEQRGQLNQRLIQREADDWLRAFRVRQQHQAESDLLMCITRFSRCNKGLSELLQEFSAIMARLSHATAYAHIKITDDVAGTVELARPDTGEFRGLLKEALGLPALPPFLKRAYSEKKPQIDLLPEEGAISSLEASFGVSLGSCLVFPLVVYERVICLMVYLIPEEALADISMRQVEIVTKASEQLTMLLERRESERRLRKQYARLKTTLVTLKNTQQQLAHSEKMASIGQLAAGIAHEINNPLSFVMSNFSSMDEYLETITRMQELNNQLLDAIDMGQQEKGEQLKTEISTLQQQSDLGFVMEDIRDIVVESRQGLLRVKDIITDLRTFARGDEAPVQLIDLEQVVAATIKLLKYQIDDHVTLEQQLGGARPFHCHSGFLQQVLTNLIKNALQAMRSAEVAAPRLSIAADWQEQQLVLKIRDNGPGLSEVMQQKIFEPFFTTKSVGEGTGLGLSVTYNLVKKLGGNIRVESEEGSYTEFIIDLPYDNETETSATPDRLIES